MAAVKTSDVVGSIKTLEAGKTVKVETALANSYKMVDGSKVRARDVIKKGNRFVEIEPVKPSEFEDSGDGYIVMLDDADTKKPAGKKPAGKKPAKKEAPAVDKDLVGRKVKLNGKRVEIVKAITRGKNVGYSLANGMHLAPEDLVIKGRSLSATVKEAKPARKPRKPAAKPEAKKPTRASGRKPRAKQEEEKPAEHEVKPVNALTTAFVQKVSKKITAMASQIAGGMALNAGEAVSDGEFYDSENLERKPIESLRINIEIPFDMTHVLKAAEEAEKMAAMEAAEADVSRFELNDAAIAAVTPKFMENEKLLARLKDNFESEVGVGDMFVDGEETEYLFAGIGMHNKSPMMVFNEAGTDNVEFMSLPDAIRALVWSKSAEEVDLMREDAIAAAQADAQGLDDLDLDSMLDEDFEDSDTDEAGDSGLGDLGLDDEDEDDDLDDADEDGADETEETDDADGEDEVDLSLDNLVTMDEDDLTEYLAENADEDEMIAIAESLELEEDDQNKFDDAEDDELPSVLAGLILEYVETEDGDGEPESEEDEAGETEEEDDDELEALLED